jgi:hypothetical protein
MSFVNATSPWANKNCVMSVKKCGGQTGNNNNLCILRTKCSPSQTYHIAPKKMMFWQKELIVLALQGNATSPWANKNCVMSVKKCGGQTGNSTLTQNVVIASLLVLQNIILWWHHMLKDYKVGKAYEYFSSGWLQEGYFLKAKSNNNNNLCILRTKCSPSQTLDDDPHNV